MSSGRFALDDEVPAHPAHPTDTPQAQDIMAMLAELRRELDSARAERDELAQRLLAASTAPVQARPSPSPAAHPTHHPVPMYYPPPSPGAQGGFIGSQRHAKVALPSEYDGSRAKSRKFLEECWLYLDSNPMYPTDLDKMRFVLSYMKSGVAGTWSSNVTRRLMMGLNPYANYQAFLSDFEQRFAPLDEAATARTELTKLKQSDSVEDYITKFEGFADMAGFSDVDLTHRFKMGLKESVLKELYRMKPVPITLRQTQEAARQVELNYLEFQSFQSGKPAGNQKAAVSKQSAAPGWTPAQIPAAHTTQKEPDVRPMDIDKSRIGGSTVKGKCYACGQPGHHRGDPRCSHAVRAVTEERVQEIIRQAIAASVAAHLPAATPASAEPATPSGQVFEAARE
jgi:hypothetical protein